MKNNKIDTKNKIVFSNLYINYQKIKFHFKKRFFQKNEIIKKKIFFSSSQTNLKNIISYNYSTNISTKMITKQEIKTIIEKSQSFKISKSKNISNKILQFLMNLLILSLFMIFNACLNIEYCSLTFRNFVIIILKKTKNDDFNEFRNYFEFKSYKSITLFETLKKAMKIILIKKITYLAKIYELFFKNHMRNRKCISTKYVIHLLIKRIITI